MGLEVPLYFGGKGFDEIPSLKRSNAHDIVGEECRHVRSGVGILDISGFSRYEITGPNAAAWLDRLLATRLPGPGRARLAGMLGERVGSRATSPCSTGVMGPGGSWARTTFARWHMRWFNDHLDSVVEEGASTCADISDGVVGLSLSGPKSRELLEKLTPDDVSNEAMPFLSCGTIDVGKIRAKVGRLSVTGELGYEIHCSAAEHIELRRTLVEAGVDLGAVEYGFNGMGSLRLEKSFGIWTFEFRQEYTPGETGMSRWIDWSKSGFIGEEAARREKDEDGHTRSIVTIEIDALDADATGYEPIWVGEKPGPAMSRRAAMATRSTGASPWRSSTETTATSAPSWRCTSSASNAPAG